eukprot:6590994-Pyramimonas_sp.AAC.1
MLTRFRTFSYSKCGCMLHQGPKGQPFRAVLPTCFHIENGGPDCLLPEAYKPTAHFNYENRQWDHSDDLPKYKTFPGMGPKMDNKAGLISEWTPSNSDAIQTRQHFSRHQG